MVSYDELCEALNRTNARLRNQAELAELEQAGEPKATADPVQLRRTTTSRPSAKGDSFVDQPPEDTHEIDVQDVMIDDRVSEDKIRIG